MKLPELFENFMSAVDWNSLDINEKKGLFDAQIPKKSCFLHPR